MANKIYTVVKDGAPLKELKTLAAAKKLADAEGAEVFCECECVYSPTVETDSDSDSTSAEEKVDEVEQEPEAEVEQTGDMYTILHRMNVREKPSLQAKVLDVLDKGALIEATLEDDWLYLTKGGFILYGGGRFARKE